MALALSSSRRAPPKAASNPCCIDGIEQGRGLQAVARGHRARVGDPSLVDGVLHLRHNQAGALGFDLGVPVVEHLGEVVAGVHVEHRERDLPRLERLGRQVQQDGRILASAEEEDRALRFRRHLADDEDGQRLQEVEVAQWVLHGPDQGGHRSAGPGRDGARGGVVLGGRKAAAESMEPLKS